MATGLKDRTNQAGNEADDLNPGQKQYDHQFPAKSLSEAEEDALAGLESQFDEPSEDEDGRYLKNKYTNSDGDEMPVNYNADDDSDTDDNIKAAKELEESGGEGSSLYSEGSSRGGRARFFGNLGGKLKKAGPTSGIMAVVLGGAAGFSFFTSPVAIFAALEKNLTNDSSESDKGNLRMYRAYYGGILGKANCSGSKLKCKLTTITKSQLPKLKASKIQAVGQKVDKDGNALPGDDGKEGPLTEADFKDKTWRAKLTKLIFPNKVTVTSSKELFRETDRNLQSRSLLSKVGDMRTATFISPKFNKLLGKFGLSKSSVTQKKPELTREEARSIVENEADKQKGTRKTTRGKTANPADIIQIGIGTSCVVYNIARVVSGTIKTKWAADLIAFSLPYMQLASKMQNMGTLNAEDMKLVEKLGNQLTWYQSEKYTDKRVAEKQVEIDKASDKEEKDKLVEEREMIKAKQDLTATDSQGLRMAMYGDTTNLERFTQLYTTGGIAGVLAIDGITSRIQSFFGGKENVRNLCVANANAGLAMTVGCIKPPIVTSVAICAGGAIAIIAALNAIVPPLMKAITDTLVRALENADLTSDLRGVDAGNAIAAGMGLLMAHKARSEGFKPAKNKKQVEEYGALTNDTYYKEVQELAEYEAKKEPFNFSNQYSFGGRIALAMNPYNATSPTGFSSLANIMAFLSSSLGQTANALHSQPSLMTNNEANLNHRMNINPETGEAECPDVEMRDAGLACDWSGEMIAVVSPRVLQWAKEQEENEHDHLADTIDYMQNKQEANEPEGGTGDETCGNAITDPTNHLLEPPFDVPGFDVPDVNCDDSRKPSIDENGKPVEGSQYEKWIKYCGPDREQELGSTSEDIEVGTKKDQAWKTGGQCGSDSMMMDRFFYYYNMCNVQAAAADDVEDCTSDVADDAIISDCAGKGTETDTKNIYVCAKKYDNYAYRFNGGREGNAHDWIKNFNDGNVTEYDPILDASGLVRMAYVEAMDEEAPALEIPNGYANSPLWEAIPLDKAEQGDIVTTNVHVAIVESNDPKKKEFKLFSAQAAGEPLQDNINESTLSYNKVKAAYRAKK